MLRQRAMKPRTVAATLRQPAELKQPAQQYVAHQGYEQLEHQHYWFQSQPQLR
jgi:hypothetical protein